MSTRNSMIGIRGYVTAEICPEYIFGYERRLQNFRSFGTDLKMAEQSVFGEWHRPPEPKVSFDTNMWWPPEFAPFFSAYPYKAFCPVFRGGAMVGVILDMGD